MKSLKEKINESKNALYSEVQNEIEQNAAYHTLKIEDAMNKYKFGFVTLNSEEGFISISAFNKPSDFSELTGEESDEFNGLEKINVKDSKDIMSATGVMQTWFRIW